jgi:hypothetical protein
LPNFGIISSAVSSPLLTFSITIRNAKLSLGSESTRRFRSESAARVSYCLRSFNGIFRAPASLVRKFTLGLNPKSGAFFWHGGHNRDAVAIMSIIVEDYCVIADRAKLLGLVYPRGMAILPRNFDSANTISEIVHEDSATTIRKLFRQQEVHETQVENPGQKLPRIQENAEDLLLPTLFVTADLYSQNPYLVSLAINIISGYAMDCLKGLTREGTVKMSLVFERDEKKISKRLRYNGPVSGLKDLEQAMQKFNDDET